jgi:hypothetical protein
MQTKSGLISIIVTVLVSVGALAQNSLAGELKSQEGSESKEAERLGLLPDSAATPAVATPAQVSSAETTNRTEEDGGTGPYPAVVVSDRTLTTHTVFRPQDLNAFGQSRKLPIVAWGNGACANSPWEHVNFLSEVASHGFLVIAIGPMPAEGQRGAPGGSTTSSLMTDAINWAMAQNDDATSQYYGKLDSARMFEGEPCGVAKVEGWKVERKNLH